MKRLIFIFLSIFLLLLPVEAKIYIDITSPGTTKLGVALKFSGEAETYKPLHSAVKQRVSELKEMFNPANEISTDSKLLALGQICNLLDHFNFVGTTEQELYRILKGAENA